jgi:hypothetical protein
MVGEFHLPEQASSITLTYWWLVESDDPEPHTDVFDILVEYPGGMLDGAHHTAGDTIGVWIRDQIDLTAHAGQSIFVLWQARNGPSHPSNWFVDDVRIEVCPGQVPGWGLLFLPLVVRGP